MGRLWKIGSSLRRAVVPALLLVGAALAFGGCRRAQGAEATTTSLDQAGMYFNSVAQLRNLGVNDAEVRQLVAARQAGVKNSTCIALVEIAHSRHQLFNDASVVSGLIQSGLQDSTVVELDRLGQLSLWSGEAQAMKLAGLSDSVILAVARRRAAHLPVLSGAKVAELQNVGLSEGELIEEIDRGITNTEANAIIRVRTNAAGGHYFVHQGRRRRR